MEKNDIYQAWEQNDVNEFKNHMYLLRENLDFSNILLEKALP